MKKRGKRSNENRFIKHLSYDATLGRGCTYAFVSQNQIHGLSHYSTGFFCEVT